MLNPSPYVIFVEPSLVEQNHEQRASGLIAVHDQAPTLPVRRGVITDIGSALSGEDDDDFKCEVGDVLLYRHGVEIGDGREAVYCEFKNIIGWETN
jgi:hypothetical protein